MKKSFKDYIRIIINNFYFVVVLMILTGILTFYYIQFMNSKYQIKSTLLFQYDGDYTYEKLKTYTKYLKTNDILEKVNNNLDVKTSIKQLEESISINLIKNTNMIEITFMNNDAVYGEKLVTELINVFINDIEKMEEGLKIHIVEMPRLVTDKLNKDIYMSISLSISFVVGCLLVMMFGSYNINIKNHEDLKKYLNMKTLGAIPNNLKKETKKAKLNFNIDMINNSSSVAAESYRMVRTNLDFLDLKVINFTSTTVGEGKSETISNIALSFSMIGKKVLLIDCDLRKPKIHKNFHLNRALGLSDLIIYNRIDEYQKIIQEFKIPDKEYKIDVLTAGSKVSNPSEILSSKRFKTLIDKVSNDYDLILIDCCPVSLMTDSVIVSKVVSGTVYVIEYNRMNYLAINKCIEQLNDINANILGSVITKLDINKQKKFYGKEYETYYNNYIS